MLEINKYFVLLDNIKREIKQRRIIAAVAVNAELIALYWSMGKVITESLGQSNWGDSFLVQLSKDLMSSFPNSKGFSKSNLYNINKWYNFYKSAGEFFQQAVGKIPWGHNVMIVSKARDLEEAKWYIDKTLENGWSRTILNIQVESDLYKRQVGSAQINNFKKVLPLPQSDLVSDILKDPYVLSFIDEDKDEKALERSLVQHIQKFLLELGKGFAFIGNQYRIEVGGESFSIDLLFYHVKLKCYVALELKVGKFRPEYAGKVQFYLTALDRQVKDENDNPSIGIVLCKEKHQIIAEYALHGMTAPIGVANYEVKHKLPKNLQDCLPTPEEIEREIMRASS